MEADDSCGPNIKQFANFLVIAEPSRSGADARLLGRRYYRDGYAAPYRRIFHQVYDHCDDDIAVDNDFR